MIIMTMTMQLLLFLLCILLLGTFCLIGVTSG